MIYHYFIVFGFGEPIEENYQKDLQSHSRQLPLGTMSSSCAAAPTPATAMPVPSVAEQVKKAIHRIDKCQNYVKDSATWAELNSIKNQLASVAHALGMKEL